MNTIDRLDPVCWVPVSRPAERAQAPLAGPWMGWFVRQWRRLAAPTPLPWHDDELVELDAHTLADIGAPDPLLARAMARREMQRQERESLRVGLASGAWHHW